MKIMKNSLAFLLALMMILTLAAPALAEGSGQITITNAAAGQTYSVYKLFDATYGAAVDANKNPITAYTIKTGDQFYDDVKASSIFVLGGTDADSVRSVTSSATAEQIINWLTAKNAEGKTVLTGKKAEKEITPEAGSNTVTFDKLDYGYYFITTTSGAVITIDSANPSASVIDKNPTAPGPADDLDGDKNLNEYKYIVTKQWDEETSALKDVYINETTADVGDTLNFKIAFSATNYVTTKNGDNVDTKHIIGYTITDVPDGLKVNTNSFVVKVNGKALTKGTELAKDVYTLGETDDTAKNPVINLMWATYDTTKEVYTSIYTSPITVEIDFSAEVRRAGTSYNDVTITYTTATLDSENKNIIGTVVTADTSHETTINNYEFTLNKVDGSDNPLEGAEFKLYTKTVSGDATTYNPITLVKVTDATSGDYYRPKHSADTTTANVIEVSVDDEDTADKNEAGVAVIKGLDTGKYYLEETKAPDGYNKLDDKTEVTVSSTTENSVDVVNQAGVELPSTGGVGTTVFYIAGGVLVLLAIVLLAGKKRGESKKR